VSFSFLLILGLRPLRLGRWFRLLARLCNIGNLVFEEKGTL
jgi:hypothetical protein